jgi:hypothetical protein
MRLFANLLAIFVHPKLKIDRLIVSAFMSYYL